MLEDELESYLKRCENRGLSPNSVYLYRSILSRAAVKVRELGRASFIDLTPDDVYEVVGMWSGISPNTRHGYLKIFEEFVEWMGCDAVKAADILVPKTVPHRVRVSDLQLRTALGAASSDLRMVMVLGSMMGLRRKEIMGIRLSDIRKDGILVHGKGHGTEGKMAIQYMPEGVKKEISEYMKVRGSASDLLVVVRDRSGKVRNDMGYRNSWVTNEYQKLSAQVGFKITSHSMRRFFGTSIYRSTGDIMLTKSALRHESIETTQIYIQTEEDKMRSAINSIEKIIIY